jgi:ATP-dependent Clp protease protease subunit
MEETQMTNGDPVLPPVPPPVALPQQQQMPSEVFATFVGVIDQITVHRILTGVGAAMASKVKHVHLLFQSTGGTVADGICLYNFLHRLPIEISLYNVGTVASIGALAYLGAKIRKTSASATFMLHRTQVSPQGATAERLQAFARNVTLDDERTEAILRQRLKMPKDLWDVHRVADLWLSANEAVKYGLATEIGGFAPPFGTQIFNV